MKKKLNLIRGASNNVEVGQFLFINDELMGDRIYRVVEIDTEKDEVWGVWEQDMPTEKWWTLNRDRS